MSKPVLVNVKPLQRWMADEGWSQKRLAAALGITPEYLSRLLHQDTSPSLDVLYRLETVTGISWFTLMLPAELAVVPREDAEFVQSYRAFQRRALQTA